MTRIEQRLRERDVIILDGGTGTEIQRRGAPMDDIAWCAAATKTHPDIVRAVHEDYIRAGADVITANTFGTARHVLEHAGLADEVATLNLQAVALAREARDAAERPVWVAGSLSSMVAGFQLAKKPDLAEAEASYREQADLLAEAGADLLLAEMMMDLEHAACTVKAAVATGLPVWVGFSCRVDGSTIRMFRAEHSDPDSDPAFDEVIGPIMAIGGSVAGVMHSEVETTPPALEVLFRHWKGPVMAYAESGEEGVPIEWPLDKVMAPADYAREACRWVEMGVQIVGGCCGTGPEHVTALRDHLPRSVPARPSD